MIDIERYTEFLIKHKMSPAQFLFLWYLLQRKFSLLYRYCTEIRPFSKGEINDMIEKGFIEKPKEATEGLFADDFQITQKFRDLIFSQDPDLMFEEFWNAYPNFLFIDSKRVPTKGTNMEDLEERYVKLIKQNLPLHHCIMNTIEWARTRGYLNTGILKFFESRGWEAIYSEMKSSVEQGELPAQNEF